MFVSCFFMSGVKQDDVENGLQSDKEFEENIAKMFGETLNKQELFDRFLTYRRRLARLGAVQTLYLMDLKEQSSRNSANNLFKFDNRNSDKRENEVFAFCQEVIHFYKNVFFTQQEYGWTKKNKKMDEDFMYNLVFSAVSNINEIDRYIQNRLSGNWTIEKLDCVLRGIIRCAVAEIMLGSPIEKAVLCSEYTNVASNFFSSKEVGFINGIVDKLYGDMTKTHPFSIKSTQANC